MQKNKLFNPYSSFDEFVFNKRQEATLRRAGFGGLDASLDVSLFEQGFIFRATGSPGEIFVVRRCFPPGRPNAFDTGIFSESDFENDFDWILEDVEKLRGFLDYLGETREDWLARSLGQRLFDVAGYFGPEDAFGSACNALTLGQILRLIKGPLRRD